MRRSLTILLALCSCSGPPAPERGVDTTLNEAGDAQTGDSYVEHEAQGPADPTVADGESSGSEGSVEIRGVPADSDDDGEEVDAEAETAAESTPPAAVSRAASLQGHPGMYFSADNYPPAAIRAGAQGRVVARLTVGTDGRVSGCEVVSSSGNEDLDAATCRTATNRVYFFPALDAARRVIASSYTLPVRWVLP